MPKLEGNKGLADVISELTKALTFEPFASLIAELQNAWWVGGVTEIRVSVVPKPGHRQGRAWIGGLHRWLSAADETIKLLAGKQTGGGNRKKEILTLEVYAAMESLDDPAKVLGEIYHHLIHAARRFPCRGYNRETDTGLGILTRFGFKRDAPELLVGTPREMVEGIPIDWSVFDEYREPVTTAIKKPATMTKLLCDCIPPSRVWVGSLRVIRRGLVCGKCNGLFGTEELKGKGNGNG